MINVVHIKNTQALQKHAKSAWACLSCSSSLDPLDGILSKELKESVATQIEDVTAEVRQNFVEFIGQVANQQEDKVLWYASRMASKSMSQTDIFHQYVYLKLVESAGRNRTEDFLFVTDDPYLLMHLYRIELENVHVYADGYETVAYPDGWFRKFCKYVALKLRLLFVPKIDLHTVTTLLHAWVDERTLKTSPRTDDPYFADLEYQLEEAGETVARLAPVSVPFGMIAGLRRSVPNIVFPMSYIKLSHLLKSFATRFHIDVEETAFSGIADLDVLLYLLDAEVRKENRTFGFVDYLIHYHAYRDMASRILDMINVVYLYENQPWEKMLNLGLTGCRRIGYQHSTIPENWLDYYTSANEQGEPRPERVLTSGDFWTEFLQRSNPNLKSDTVGTLRYRYLFKESRSEGASSSQNIVVALPLGENVALQLQDRILEILREDFALNYQFKIKAHPRLDESALRKKKFATHSNCTWTDDSIHALSEDAALFIAADTTAAFEVFLAGQDVLLYVPDSLTYGFEFLMRDAGVCVYDNDIVGRTREVLRRESSGNERAGEYFQEFDHDKLFAALGIRQGVKEAQRL